MTSRNTGIGRPKHRAWKKPKARRVKTGDGPGFARAAASQPCCAACGDRWRLFDCHHVVYEQTLRQRGLPDLTAENALRLCRPCHSRHHDGSEWQVPLASLTDDNIAYAFEALGEWAGDYLRRHYAGDDPRIGRLAA